LTGLMSAWQCDGPRRHGLLQSADVRDGPLIAQSLRGTPEAFVEIVRRHEVAIHGYLTRRAGLRAADDLLGEVWVRAFGARHRYDTSHEDARPWLYGIARNVLRAHWRTGQNIDLALPEEALDPWDEITDRLDSAMRARALVSALRELPAPERDVLLLVAWEQLTPAEAAITLSIPPGTARSRLHRARATLRQMLAEPADETEVRK
jgi:RNA polymerase sigma factor (sigma-70 family)